MQKNIPTFPLGGIDPLFSEWRRIYLAGGGVPGPGEEPKDRLVPKEVTEERERVRIIAETAKPILRDAAAGNPRFTRLLDNPEMFRMLCSLIDIGPNGELIFLRGSGQEKYAKEWSTELKVAQELIGEAQKRMGTDYEVYKAKFAKARTDLDGLQKRFRSDRMKTAYGLTEPELEHFASGAGIGGAIIDRERVGELIALPQRIMEAYEKLESEGKSEREISTELTKAVPPLIGKIIPPDGSPQERQVHGEILARLNSLAADGKFSPLDLKDFVDYVCDAVFRRSSVVEVPETRVSEMLKALRDKKADILYPALREIALKTIFNSPDYELPDGRGVAPAGKKATRPDENVPDANHILDIFFREYVERFHPGTKPEGLKLEQKDIKRFVAELRSSLTNYRRGMTDVTFRRRQAQELRRVIGQQIAGRILTKNRAQSEAYYLSVIGSKHIVDRAVRGDFSIDFDRIRLDTRVLTQNGNDVTDPEFNTKREEWLKAISIGGAEAIANRLRSPKGPTISAEGVQKLTVKLLTEGKGNITVEEVFAGIRPDADIQELGKLIKYLFGFSIEDHINIVRADRKDAAGKDRTDEEMREIERKNLLRILGGMTLTSEAAREFSALWDRGVVEKWIDERNARNAGGPDAIQKVFAAGRAIENTALGESATLDVRVFTALLTNKDIHEPLPAPPPTIAFDAAKIAALKVALEITSKDLEAPLIAALQAVVLPATLDHATVKLQTLQVFLNVAGIPVPPPAVDTAWFKGKIDTILAPLGDPLPAAEIPAYAAQIKTVFAGAATDKKAMAKDVLGAVDPRQLHIIEQVLASRETKNDTAKLTDHLKAASDKWQEHFIAEQLLKELIRPTDNPPGTLTLDLNGLLAGLRLVTGKYLTREVLLTALGNAVYSQPMDDVVASVRVEDKGELLQKLTGFIVAQTVDITFRERFIQEEPLKSAVVLDGKSFDRMDQSAQLRLKQHAALESAVISPQAITKLSLDDGIRETPPKFDVLKEIILQSKQGTVQHVDMPLLIALCRYLSSDKISAQKVQEALTDPAAPVIEKGSPNPVSASLMPSATGQLIVDVLSAKGILPAAGLRPTVIDQLNKIKNDHGGILPWYEKITEATKGSLKDWWSKFIPYMGSMDEMVIGNDEELRQMQEDLRSVDTYIDTLEVLEGQHDRLERRAKWEIETVMNGNPAAACKKFDEYYAQGTFSRWRKHWQAKAFLEKAAFIVEEEGLMPSDTASGATSGKHQLPPDQRFAVLNQRWNAGEKKGGKEIPEVELASHRYEERKGRQEAQRIAETGDFADHMKARHDIQIAPNAINILKNQNLYRLATHPSMWVGTRTNGKPEDRDALFTGLHSIMKDALDPKTNQPFCPGAAAGLIEAFLSKSTYTPSNAGPGTKPLSSSQVDTLFAQIAVSIELQEKMEEESFKQIRSGQTTEFRWTEHLNRLMGTTWENLKGERGVGAFVGTALVCFLAYKAVRKMWESDSTLSKVALAVLAAGAIDYMVVEPTYGKSFIHELSLYFRKEKDRTSALSHFVDAEKGNAEYLDSEQGREALRQMHGIPVKDLLKWRQSVLNAPGGYDAQKGTRAYDADLPAGISASRIVGQMKLPQGERPRELGLRIAFEAFDSYCKHIAKMNGRGSAEQGASIILDRYVNFTDPDTAPFANTFSGASFFQVLMWESPSPEYLAKMLENKSLVEMVVTATGQSAEWVKNKALEYGSLMLVLTKHGADVVVREYPHILDKATNVGETVLDYLRQKGAIISAELASDFMDAWRGMKDLGFKIIESVPGTVEFLVDGSFKVTEVSVRALQSFYEFCKRSPTFKDLTTGIRKAAAAAGIDLERELDTSEANRQIHIQELAQESFFTADGVYPVRGVRENLPRDPYRRNASLRFTDNPPNPLDAAETKINAVPGAGAIPKATIILILKDAYGMKDPSAEFTNLKTCVDNYNPAAAPAVPVDVPRANIRDLLGEFENKVLIPPAIAGAPRIPNLNLLKTPAGRIRCALYALPGVAVAADIPPDKVLAILNTEFVATGADAIALQAFVTGHPVKQSVGSIDAFMTQLQTFLTAPPGKKNILPPASREKVQTLVAKAREEVSQKVFTVPYSKLKPEQRRYVLEIVDANVYKRIAADTEVTRLQAKYDADLLGLQTAEDTARQNRDAKKRALDSLEGQLKTDTPEYSLAWKGAPTMISASITSAKVPLDATKDAMDKNMIEQGNLTIIINKGRLAGASDPEKQAMNVAIPKLLKLQAKHQDLQKDFKKYEERVLTLEVYLEMAKPASQRDNLPFVSNHIANVFIRNWPEALQKPILSKAFADAVALRHRVEALERQINGVPGGAIGARREYQDAQKEYEKKAQATKDLQRKGVDPVGMDIVTLFDTATMDSTILSSAHPAQDRRITLFDKAFFQDRKIFGGVPLNWALGAADTAAFERSMNDWISLRLSVDMLYKQYAANGSTEAVAYERYLRHIATTEIFRRALMQTDNDPEGQKQHHFHVSMHEARRIDQYLEQTDGLLTFMQFLRLYPTIKVPASQP